MEAYGGELESYPHFSPQSWAASTNQYRKRSEEKRKAAGKVLGVGSIQEESFWPRLVTVLALELLSEA